MTTNSWLSAEDINNETADQSGRPISPAPLVDGDLNSAETIKVEFPDNGQSVTMDRRDFVRLGGAATAAAGLTATIQTPVDFHAVAINVDIHLQDVWDVVANRGVGVRVPDAPAVRTRRRCSRAPSAGASSAALHCEQLRVG